MFEIYIHEHYMGKTSVADPDPLDPYVLGLLEPDPDPLVRGMNPDPSITKQD